MFAAGIRRASEKTAVDSPQSCANRGHPLDLFWTCLQATRPKESIMTIKPFDPFNVGNPFGDPLLDRTLDNLGSTLDPRDQMAVPLRQFRQFGVGNHDDFLRARTAQIDPRDQEAYDIREMLRGKPW